MLRDVKLEIKRGEVLGLVGQSGSGKSTLAMAILGLLDKQARKPKARFVFRIAISCNFRSANFELCAGEPIALVLQSPLSSLNPALKIRTQLKEAWRAHASGTSAECTAAIRTSPAKRFAALRR